MVRFLSGFILGVGVGIAAGMLLNPDSSETAREKLRVHTSDYASGDNTLVSTLQSEMENQRLRFEQAIEVGRRVSAQRQQELWAQLKLTPPAPDPKGSTDQLATDGIPISTDHLATDSPLLS